MKKSGYVLILIGLLLTVFTTVTFFSRERVAKIGDINITANKRHKLAWSPLVGTAVMAVGGLVVGQAPKKEYCRVSKLHCEKSTDCPGL